MKAITPARIRIEKAAEDDLPAISKLAAVIWRACYPGLISGEQIEYMLGRMYALAVLRDEVCRQGIRFDRLILDGELVGFASYGPAAQPGVIKLHKLYVDPDWQGRGLGSLLLQHCEREAAKLGADKLELSVNKRNSKAISTYQRNGFVIAESVVTDIGHGFIMDDFIMTRGLACRRAS